MQCCTIEWKSIQQNSNLYAAIQYGQIGQQSQNLCSVALHLIHLHAIITLCVSCPPFSIDAARMIRTYCFIPVAIELQGKAQARSVQVTSEPSAVVPVEQKQVTKGTPKEMLTQTKFPGFYSISQGFDKAT